MIEYITQKEYCVGCRMRQLRDYIDPRPEDFDWIYFKINDVVYFEWSSEFAQAADRELIWQRLKRD